MMSEFKEMYGHPSYMINKLGEVYGKRFKKILRQNTIRGYKYVHIFSGGKCVSVRVHRAVLLTFIGPPKNGETDACHLDGNRTNNNLSNLAWKSSKENANDKKKHGTIARGSKVAHSKLTEEQVLFIKDNFWQKSKCNTNAKELAARFSVESTTIFSIIRGTTWSHVKSTKIQDRTQWKRRNHRRD